MDEKDLALLRKILDDCEWHDRLDNNAPEMLNQSKFLPSYEIHSELLKKLCEIIRTYDKIL